MPDDQNAVHPAYAINDRLRERIGAKDYLRKMEGVIREYPVSFGHPDMKRAFEREFYMTAARVQVISTMGRSRLPSAVIELIEKQLKDRIDAATAEINENIDKCATLMEASGILGSGTPLAPLHITVKVTSPIMRRYLDLMLKCDQLEVMLETLVIEEVVTIERAENEKRRAKKLVHAVSIRAQEWEVDLRKKIAELERDEAQAAAEKEKAKRAKPHTKASGESAKADAVQESLTGPMVEETAEELALSGAGDQ